MCVCVCVFVCGGERGKGSEREEGETEYIFVRLD